MLASACSLPSEKPPFVTRKPRILSSYLRTSNYSSAHLTRMNDIVKVSSSARGSARGIAGDRGVGPMKIKKNKKRKTVVERASGPDFTPTLLGRPEQT